ncbi:MAG: MAPEG family protein [Alphaproteobacteria bacterium]|nr:MAG: MAPEG family protein [Alphaproteobacteria bacterium]
MPAAFHVTVIVSVLALFINIVFALRVGQARGRLEVPAPATTGPDEFNRLYRIHQNTVEQTVLFLPSLWLFHAVFHSIWGAVMGLVWVAGRLVYSSAYRKDPSRRGPGMMLTFASSLALMLSALVGSIVALV